MKRRSISVVLAVLDRADRRAQRKSLATWDFGLTPAGLEDLRRPRA
jgi:hypothetical protein